MNDAMYFMIDQMRQRPVCEKMLWLRKYNLKLTKGKAKLVVKSCCIAIMDTR